MSEETSLENGTQPEVSAFDLLLSSQETYEEALTRAAEEDKKFVKTEFFRMDKMGTYRFRVLLLAPDKNNPVDRKAFDYPVHQMLLKIATPQSKNKKSHLYLTVPRTDYAGYSVDIISLYKKLAVAQANSKNDEELAKKIGSDGFNGGLQYKYQNGLYVFDLDDRKKGVQLLYLSNAQYKDLRSKRDTLWGKKTAKDKTHPCPVSSILKAYPVEVERKKEGGKTNYVISIDNESDYDELSRAECDALMGMPRIPEIIYRYTRYQFGATVEFLNQCDAGYGLSIMNTEEMQEAIKKLESELPADDTRTFSFQNGKGDADAGAADGTTLSIDHLLDKFDELTVKGLGDKTEEGQELRAMIREFIEENELDIRVTRTTSNEDLLVLIEEKLK